MIKGIPSNRCPADSFIKYFRECKAKQEEFKKQGKEVPEEYKTPDKVYLTENYIDFLMNIVEQIFWLHLKKIVKMMI